MNKSKFSLRGNSDPQNMQFTIVRRNFEDNTSPVPKPIHPVNVVQTTAGEVSGPLITTNGNSAAPQESVDIEADAVEDLKEAMKVRCELLLYVGSNRNAIRATTPIKSAKCLKPEDVFIRCRQSPWKCAQYWCVRRCVRG